MKKLFLNTAIQLIILIPALIISCNIPDKHELDQNNLNPILVTCDSAMFDRIYKLEKKVESIKTANDSIAWEFERYRYWLWKEHNLTEPDYSKYEALFNICKLSPLNEELQKRTKLPSKNKNSLY